MAQPVTTYSGHKHGVDKSGNTALARLLRRVQMLVKPFLRLAVKLAVRITARITARIARANQRATLSGLNDHQLRDIGLTREEVGGGPGRGVFDTTSQRFYDIGFGYHGDHHRSSISKLPKE